ncbi:MAG: ATP-binding protein, partial [Oleispira sp.]|nr:ATP-binding protein [Oleispira sp.]
MSNRIVAGITNVVLCNQALARTIDRANTLPGLLVWFGHSGLGKTMAAMNASIKNKGFYVQ